MSLGYMFYDDETANSQQLICELAYVLTDFEGNQIGDPVETKINPESEFSRWNMMVHHITANDVESAPTMEQFCQQSSFLQDLSNYTFVAHSAKGSDIHHIRKSLGKYGIVMPDIEFVDTRAMAASFLESRSLPIVCSHYGIAFEEQHRALPDAIACKEIFLRMLADGIDATPEVADLDARPTRKGRKSVPITGQGRLNNSTVTIEDAMAELESEGLRGDPSSFSSLAGLTVVVSGTIPGYTRDSIIEELKSCGARATSGNVSSKAKLLVIGHNASKSRIDQAKERRVPVITAGELLEVIDNIEQDSHRASSQEQGTSDVDQIAGRSFSFALGLLTMDPFEGYQIVKMHGGIAREIKGNTSVRVDTDYFVVSDDLALGAKQAVYIDNAKSKGVSIISESDFWEMAGIELGPKEVADHWVLVDDSLEGGKVDVSNRPAWDGSVAPYKLFIQCRSAKSTHAGGWKVLACGFIDGTERFEENVGSKVRLPNGEVVFDTLREGAAPWNEWRNDIGKVSIVDRYAPRCCAHLFDGLQRCSEFDLSGLDTSRAVSFKAMFRGCSSVDYFMVTDRFDTASVTDMSEMFFGCISTSVINCIGWDLSKVESMRMMFENSPAAVLFDDANVHIPETVDTTRMFDTNPKHGRWLRRA